MWNSRAAAARREIAALATAGLGVTDLHAAVADVVSRVVGYDQTCWGCVDPHSMFVSSLISVPDPVPAKYAARFVEAEYSGTEPNTFVDLARRAVPVARMSDLPHREVVASTRLNELFHPLGLEHELRAALCVDGTCWGVTGLVRTSGSCDFSDREVEFLASVGPTIAAATRIALRTDARGRRGGDGPVVVLAGQAGDLRAATPAAASWLAELDEAAPGRFTLTLYAVVAGARAATSGTAQALMRDATDGWVVLHASRLITGEQPGQMVVIIELASGRHLQGLLFAAYGLTAREREVCLEVLSGHSTADIADRLFISVHTLQDHLKGVFAKVGVRSRRELVAKLRPEDLT